jgi:phosphoadenosine phosphosulfate reductase
MFRPVSAVATLQDQTFPSASEVEELADHFESMRAVDVIRYATERFAGRIVLTCSWQKQSSILFHLIAEAAPETRIVELDTGLFFPEAYETRDRLIERYGLQVESIRPQLAVEEQNALMGTDLWERDPDRCCALRKVAPLEQALEGMDAWITGIRRSQSSTRAQARKLQLDARRGVVKVQPLVDWSDADCWRFIMENRIPYNPLHDRGFPSIGCRPCTREVAVGEDERAGRWAGRDKTECGLHSI